MTSEEVIKIRKTLVRQVGDHRLCPICYTAFVPADRTQQEGLELLRWLKEQERREGI